MLSINPGAFRSIDALVRGKGQEGGGGEDAGGEGRGNVDDDSGKSREAAAGSDNRLEILDLAVHEDASQADDEDTVAPSAPARRKNGDTVAANGDAGSLVTEAMRGVSLGGNGGDARGQEPAAPKKVDLSGYERRTSIHP